jgi:RHS repeat-associated protein
MGQTWRNDGLLKAKTWPNGESATLAYDTARRPSAVNLTGSRSLTRTYDRTGNVTSDGRDLGAAVTGSAGHGTLTYAYDPLGRIIETKLDGVTTNTYTYDRASNRRTKTDGADSYTYVFDRTDTLINQAKNGGATSAFLYDVAGNLTTERTATSSRSLAYDPANRLVSVTPFSGNAATLAYDPLDRITTRTVGTTVQAFGYVGASDIVYQQASTALTSSTLVDPGGARVGATDGTTSGGSWLLFDLLGSVAGAESGASGASTAVTTALRYDAYGGTIGTYPSTGSTLPVRYRGLIDLAPTTDTDVAGVGSDPLYAMGARAYSPHTGAFTSLDTVAGSAQDPASLNRYLYAHANPTTLIDPTGHGVDCTIGQSCPEEDRLADQQRLREQQARERAARARKDSPPMSGPNPDSTSDGDDDAGGAPATVLVVPTDPLGPQPGPGPCGGSSGIPCPTPTPTYPATPTEFDAVGAGIAACSIAAPPPVQLGCDAQQFAAAVEGGDPVDIVANGIGFVFYVGDGVKWVIRGGRAIFEPKAGADAIKLLTSGKPPSVDTVNMLQEEIPQAWDVAKFRGGHWQGPDAKFKAGIDGTFEGTPASLKAVSVGDPYAVLSEVVRARNKAKNAGFSGVDVYVAAPNINRHTMASFIVGGTRPLTTMHQSGVIADIYIHVSDGWVIVKGQ